MVVGRGCLLVFRVHVDLVLLGVLLSKSVFGPWLPLSPLGV